MSRIREHYDVDKARPWKVEVWRDGEWLYHGGWPTMHDAIVERHRLEEVTGYMTRVCAPKGKKVVEQKDPLWWRARMAAERKGPPLTHEEADQLRKSPGYSGTLVPKSYLTQRGISDAPVLPPGTKRG